MSGDAPEEKTWKDMPGTDSETKKINFALWKRGLLEISDVYDTDGRLIEHAGAANLARQFRAERKRARARAILRETVLAAQQAEMEEDPLAQVKAAASRLARQTQHGEGEASA